VTDHGDVVKFKVLLNLKRPIEPIEFFYDRYIDVYMGDTLPSDINETLKEKWPDRWDIGVEIMLNPFRDNVLGMREGRKKDFTILASELKITNTTDIFYNADLLFSVECLEIIYDHIYEPIPELSLDDPIVIISLTGLVALGLVLYSYKIPQRLYQGVTTIRSLKCSTCNKPTNLICSNTQCRKPVCRTCFQEKKGCPACSSVKILFLHPLYNEDKILAILIKKPLVIMSSFVARTFTNG
jgi:hypothetical protein